MIWQGGCLRKLGEAEGKHVNHDMIPWEFHASSLKQKWQKRFTAWEMSSPTWHGANTREKDPKTKQGRKGSSHTFQVHALPCFLFGTSIPEHGESINMKKNTSTNKPNSWLAALTFKHLFHPALMPDKMCAPRSVSWYNSCRCHRLHQFQKLLQSLLSGPFVLVCVLSYQKSTVGHIPIIKVFNKHVKKHKEHVSRGSHARVATSPSAQPLAPRGAWCASFPGYPSAL